MPSSSRSDRPILNVGAGTIGLSIGWELARTGFPFKVLTLPGTLAEDDRRQRRPRICDLGYLREPYVDEKGRLLGRCPSEPVDDYVRKGGDAEETEGRGCLCNGSWRTSVCRSTGTEPRSFHSTPAGMP